ncbi:hypothetical protein BC828DRAFT_372834 [Blastocladiella britannica]|nr:hypothetical protein BC828DRAFT_372834 [Blastocladiella britannica]
MSLPAEERVVPIGDADVAQRRRSELAARCKGIRCIAHLDLDCFYAQVEHLRLGIPTSTPLAVQQWQGLIAVNYAARAAGIHRHMNVTEARAACPELVAVHVATYTDGASKPMYHERPNARDHKVSLEPYRRTSASIFAIIARHFQAYERASIDECFVDLSAAVEARIAEQHLSSTWLDDDVPAFNWNEDRAGILFPDATESETAPPTWADYMLWIAAQLVADLRQAIANELHLTCSAGIAHNKTIAKLCSSIHKPNKQTTMRERCVLDFLAPLALSKIRSLGGKLGSAVESQMDVKTCLELRAHSLEDLMAQFDPALARWLHAICRGQCDQQVLVRSKTKSMMAAKRLRPPATSVAQLDPWISILVGEMFTRVSDDHEVHRRWPKTLVVHIQPTNGDAKSRSSGFPAHQLMLESPDALVARSSSIIASFGPGIVPCSFISLQCHGFETVEASAGAMSKWIKSADDPVSSSSMSMTNLGELPADPLKASAQSTASIAPPPPQSFFAARQAEAEAAAAAAAAAASDQFSSHSATVRPTATTMAAVPVRPTTVLAAPPPSPPAYLPQPPPKSGGAFELLERERERAQARRTAAAAGSAAAGGSPKTAPRPESAGFSMLARERERSRGQAKQTRIDGFLQPRPVVASAAAKRKRFEVLSDDDEDDSDGVGAEQRQQDDQWRMEQCPQCGDEYPACILAEHEAYHQQQRASSPPAPLPLPPGTGLAGVDNDMDDLELVACPKCDDQVPRLGLQEHLDFHIAMELSEQTG